VRGSFIPRKPPLTPALSPEYYTIRIIEQTPYFARYLGEREQKIATSKSVSKAIRWNQEIVGVIEDDPISRASLA
jgi:hypothetical protein